MPLAHYYLQCILCSALSSWWLQKSSNILLSSGIPFSRLITADFRLSGIRIFGTPPMCSKKRSPFCENLGEKEKKPQTLWLSASSVFVGITGLEPATSRPPEVYSNGLNPVYYQRLTPYRYL